MRVWRARWSWLRSTASARRALALITVLAVGLAGLMGGHRYFYCRPMNRIMAPSHCPCARANNDDRHATTLGVLNDCFEVRVLDHLVSFTTVGDFAVPAAMLVGVLPAIPWPLHPSSIVPERVAQPIRAGPYSPAGMRAQLMVFLT